MKRITLTCLAVISAILLFAQPPQAFKYQAVVRDAAGTIISNQMVDFLISIHDATPGGSIVYQETHSGTTNQFGLISLNIGLGSPIPPFNFGSINWRVDSKFLEVEIDLIGGGTYISMGSSELFSVPYALFSDESANGYWELNSSDIYYNSGNVGIGTHTPNVVLHVDDRIRVGEDLTYPTVFGELIHEGGGSGFRMNANAGGGGWADIHFQTNGTTKMFLESAGNFGIGTISPGERLEVNGKVAANDGVIVESASGDGIHIELANQRGVYIENVGGVGIHIGSAADNGLQIDFASMDGIHIPSTGNDGIYIGSVQTGVHVASADNSGFYIGSAVGHGFSVNSTSMDGLNVYNSWDDGVYINQALDIGVYANTTNGAGQWGFYTPDLIYSSKGYMGAKIIAYGKYIGAGTLMPGELVCIAGGYEENIPDEGSIPVIYVDKSGSTNSESLFGVVEYKVRIKEETEKFENGETEIQKSFRFEEGNINTGDYLAIIVFGPADVKVDNKDIIQAGHKLTVSEINGTARQILNSDSWTVGLLGKALEDSDGSGKIQVFVNCK